LGLIGGRPCREVDGIRHEAFLGQVHEVVVGDRRFAGACRSILCQDEVQYCELFLKKNKLTKINLLLKNNILWLKTDSAVNDFKQVNSPVGPTNMAGTLLAINVSRKKICWAVFIV